MSILVTCHSRLNKDLFTENKKSKFINLIPALDCSEGGWQIGLTFLKVSLSNAEIGYFDILTVHIEEVSCIQGGNNIRDTCIYELLNTTKFPHQIHNPIYLPLKPINLNRLHISVRNETLREADLTRHCTMSFHLMRKTLSPPTKILRTFSNIQTNLYPNNGPMQYINGLSLLFHENLDFTKWEIALESIIIDKSVLRWMMESFTDLDCISIYVNIIKDQAVGDQTCKLLTIIPILRTAAATANQTLTWNEEEKTGGTFYFHYRPRRAIFVPIAKKNLDEIEVTLAMDHSGKKTMFKDFDGDRNDMVNITFILRLAKMK